MMERDLLRRFLEARVGIWMSDAAVGRLDELVARRKEAVGYRSTRDYVAALEADAMPGELQSLIDLVTVTKTAFFRHPSVISAVVNDVLPTIEPALPPSEPIRIWSAACATGEEPYSLAMALHRSGWLSRRKVTILATDVSEAALERARAAEYQPGHRGAEAFPEGARPYLEPSGRGYRVSRRVREAVEFERRNLACLDANGEQPWHVILCCNVLIYFRSPLRDQVIARLAEKVATPGALLFGSAEVVATSPRPLRLARIGDAFVHLRGRWEGLLAAEAPRPRPPPPSLVSMDCRPVSAPGAVAPRGAERVNLAEPPPPAYSGGSDPAVEPLELRIERDPLDSEAHYLRARSLRELGRTEDAEEMFRKAVFLNPAFGEARYELARLRHGRGDFVNAAREYARALESMDTRLPVASDDEGSIRHRFVVHLCRLHHQAALRGEGPIDSGSSGGKQSS